MLILFSLITIVVAQTIPPSNIFRDPIFALNSYGDGSSGDKVVLENSTLLLSDNNNLFNDLTLKTGSSLILTRSPLFVRGTLFLYDETKISCNGDAGGDSINRVNYKPTGGLGAGRGIDARSGTLFEYLTGSRGAGFYKTSCYNGSNAQSFGQGGSGGNGGRKNSRSCIPGTISPSASRFSGIASLSAITLSGGAGGGVGGGFGSSIISAAGGGGGGVARIFARKIVIVGNSTIRINAAGGDGGSCKLTIFGPGNECSGGGGGGGGNIFIIYSFLFDNEKDRSDPLPITVINDYNQTRKEPGIIVNVLGGRGGVFQCQLPGASGFPGSAGSPVFVRIF